MQLYRIFPISHNYYLSKLIFSPDASKPSRILIGKEVHTADEYNVRIAPFYRHWPSPLLRFSIFDETPHKVPSSAVDQSLDTPSLLPFMVVPPPPVILSPPVPPRTLSFDPQDLGQFQCRSPSLQSFSPSFIPPPPPPIIFSDPLTPPARPSPSPPHFPPLGIPPQSCCSVAKGKSEMETLLSSFKKDFDRVMRNTFGPEYDSKTEVDTSDLRAAVPSVEKSTAARSTPVEPHYTPAHTLSDTPSSHWCFVCRNKFSGSWYGCVKCPWHFVVRVLVWEIMCFAHQLSVSKLFL